MPNFPKNVRASASGKIHTAPGVTADLRKWDAMVKRVVALGQYRAHVGVLATKGGAQAHKDAEISLLELAAIHEYGSPAAGIPERSFIRSAFKDQEARTSFLKVCSDLAGQVLNGKTTAQKATRILGMHMVSLVKKRIMSGPGIPPPNKPMTIKRKGSSRPLVDTGQLVGAITYEVRKSGGKK